MHKRGKKMSGLKIELHRVCWNVKSCIANRNFGLVLRSVCVVVCVMIFSTIGIHESLSAQLRLQEGIASEIIRFHVIANSDLESDQQVKLKVKDAIVTAMRPRMVQCNDITDARKVILENQDYINEIARKTLRQYGYDDTVNVSLAKEQFPIKVYGDITLPAGEYEALCVRIGKAEGHNWWCIVFPSLCYVDETYSVVPAESKEQLQSVLTEEEYEEISKENAGKVKVKFKLWEYLKKYF